MMVSYLLMIEMDFISAKFRFIVFLCIITIITVGIMILICQEMYLLLKIIEAGITCSVQRMQNCLWKKWNVFNKIAKEAGIPGAEKVMKKTISDVSNALYSSYFKLHVLQLEV